MLRFFTNRDLADKLEINLQRWKRWSREFLPPDPLGGLQSGLARQYTAREAFVVFLAGHLVAELNFPIPAARQILSDLPPFLNELGIFDLLGRLAGPTVELPEGVTAVHVRIFQLKASGGRPLRFAYQMRRCRRLAPHPTEGAQCFEDVRLESSPAGEAPMPQAADLPSWRTLNIIELYRRFMTRLNPAAGGREPAG